jgi:AraC family transcriptional regulator of adaptative response/methylated-DNA-[protein]-cysteine methyltransferase
MTKPEKKDNNSRKEPLSYSFHNSRWGQVLIASSSSGICFVSFPKDMSHGVDELQSNFPNAVLIDKDEPAHDRALEVIDGKVDQAAKIKLDISGSSFQKKVWDALFQIPYGNTSTYSAIAHQIGMPKATRAVGNAIGKNKIAVLIPCHRVVRSNGKLSGYRWGTNLKEQILREEEQQR